jgi:hypothetical protein
VAGLHGFIRHQVAESEGSDVKRCQIVDAHYFRGRPKALNAEPCGVLLRERAFDDVLVSRRLGQRTIDRWSRKARKALMSGLPCPACSLGAGACRRSCARGGTVPVLPRLFQSQVGASSRAESETGVGKGRVDEGLQHLEDRTKPSPPRDVPAANRPVRKRSSHPRPACLYWNVPAGTHESALGTHIRSLQSVAKARGRPDAESVCCAPVPASRVPPVPSRSWRCWPNCCSGFIESVSLLLH